jgi:hypothetical protein
VFETGRLKKHWLKPLGSHWCDGHFRNLKIKKENLLLCFHRLISIEPRLSSPDSLENLSITSDNTSPFALQKLP